MTNEGRKDIESFLSNVQDFAESQIINEPNALTERLAQTGVYIAYMGRLTAICKKIVSEAKAEVLDKYGEKLFKVQATIVKDLMNGKCKDAIFLLDWAINLEDSLKSQSDEIRTLISYAKHEAELFSQGYNQNVQIDNNQNFERS